MQAAAEAPVLELTAGDIELPIDYTAGSAQVTFGAPRKRRIPLVGDRIVAVEPPRDSVCAILVT
jgi:hypothetical protein